MDSTASPRAVILLGHGSRGTAQARPFAAMCRWLESARPGLRSEDAYLSLCPPTLDQAVDLLAAQGIGAMDVLPMFLVEGHHIRRDLPLALKECAKRHPGVRLRLAPTLAADSAIVELLLRRLEQAGLWDLGPALERNGAEEALVGN